MNYFKLRKRLIALHLFASTACCLGLSTSLQAQSNDLPLACKEGVYELQGAPLFGSTAASTITLRSNQVSVGTLCSPIGAKRIRKLGKVRYIADWRSCKGIPGPVHLEFSLYGTGCGTLRGEYAYPKLKRAKGIRAALVLPDEAFGRLRDPLPPGSSLITQEEAEFAREDSPFHPIGKRQGAFEQENLAKLSAEDISLVDRQLSLNPELGGLFSLATDKGDEYIRPSIDGNILFALFSGEQRQERQIITNLGRASSLALAAEAIRREPTLANNVNQYGEWVDALSEVEGGSEMIPFPKEAAERVGLETLRKTNLELSRRVFERFYPDLFPVVPKGGIPPEEYPESCGEEEGAGDGTDRTGSVCAHKSLGVYDNYAWPLKYYNTCVKNQGGRGTCVSFAINAAVEGAVAKKYDRWVNLSEQYLYFKAKGVWWPTETGDGLWTHGVWSKMVQESYVHPFEEQWDYNPSYSRSISNTTGKYVNSCTGYGGDQSLYCSNTAHQGRPLCFNLGFFNYCFHLPPPVGIASGYRATGEVELWDTGNLNLSFAKVILGLALAKKPVVLSINVPGSWDSPDANGYVKTALPICAPSPAGTCTPVAGSCECSRGGHAVLATGFIDNSKLPVGAPAGAGGGYIIVKNSWGACFADGGYIYLPYNWLKLHTWSATMITGVQSS